MNVLESLLLAAREWMAEGICQQVDPELWFPEKGQPSSTARRLCASCPVRVDCLRFAMETDQGFGIWGGLSERERRKLKRTGGLRDLALAA